MLSIQDWLMDLSGNCSVQHFDDIESGTFLARVKGDVYLVRHEDVKE